MYHWHLHQGCTTFLFLPAASRLFSWITAASQCKIFLFFVFLQLFQHTEPRPLPHACLAVFLQSTFIQQKIVLIHAQPVLIITVLIRLIWINAHNLHFDLHVHGRINIYWRQHAAVRPQVMHPWSRPVVLNLWGMTGRTVEPLLQNLTHHIQMLTYFTNHNHLQTVLITKATNI